jgi:uncharacterized membrane protein YuzA (DUF378 family)
MKPQSTLDWIAFLFLLIGAFAWGAFDTDVNVQDVGLEAIWDPLDNIVFVIIGVSGIYLLVRALQSR